MLGVPNRRQSHGVSRDDFLDLRILSDAEKVAVSLVEEGRKVPVMLECKNRIKLLRNYQRHGYSYLGRNPEGYNQLTKVLEGTGERHRL